MRKRMFLLLSAALIFAGCASHGGAGARTPGLMADRAAGLSAAEAQTDRLIIKTAGLTLAVEDFKKTAEAAAAIAKEEGGFVQSESQYDNGAYILIKVPSEKLDSAMAKLALIGEEKNRNVSKYDVTSQVADNEAVLKNKKALRDRLRQLANQAKDVKDIVSIESELARVQGEIDSMEAVIKDLRGRAAMSDLSLSLQKKTMPGPLGWVFMGIGWVLKFLFVW